MERKKPELLSPAGDWEKLQMAVAYGADEVYLAGTAFGMRSFDGNFTDEELPRAVGYAHDHGVKVHVTVNTMPRSGEVEQLPAHLERLNDAGVDALIVADLGAFTLAGKYAPRCQRHISTQQSVANYASASAWSSFLSTSDLNGLSRARSMIVQTNARIETPMQACAKVNFPPNAKA